MQRPQQAALMTAAASRVFLLLISLASVVAGSQLDGKMLPFHKVGSGCELHLEDHCFVQICDGFVSLGLNSNLNFSSGDDLDEKAMVIDTDKVINFGLYKNGQLKMLKIPFFKQGETGQVCIAFQQISGTSGQVRTYAYTQDEELLEHSISSYVTNNYGVVGHGGEFVIVESPDKREMKIYHMSNDLLVDTQIEIASQKMNFAITRQDGTQNSFYLVACTYDNKWNNRCEIHPIEVRVALNWLEIEPKYAFDMAEGMCAHSLVVTGEYIVYSCSKMFEDGSARKVKVLSLSARSLGRPVLIADQSTPTGYHVLVSPQDGLQVIRHSPLETTVVYAIRNTVVTIKLIADASNVSWRTWINTLNTCLTPIELPELGKNGSMVLMRQDGIDYRGALCGFHQEYDSESGLCTELDRGYYSHDGVALVCDDNITLVKAWDAHLKKVACVSSNSDFGGSSGQPFIQVDEYATIITPIKRTCAIVTKVPEKQSLVVDDSTESESESEAEADQAEMMPQLVDEWGRIVDGAATSDSEAGSTSADSDVFYNDVPAMPDDWYWRNKPLSKNRIKVGQKYWVDQGRFYFSMELCFERGLNCTDTCCKQTYCAPEMGDCIKYVRRDYDELSFCIFIILINVIGVPTCIKTTEFLIMKKFGSWLDEDENVWVGGTTFCECCTYCIKCKKNPNMRQNQKTDDATQGEGGIDDAEFEQAEGDGAKGNKGVDLDEPKKRGCCSVCCRAIFCCGGGNTVSREVELADLRVSDNNNSGEGAALLNSDEKVADDGTNIDPAGSDLDAMANAAQQDDDKEADIAEDSEEEESDVSSVEEEH